MLPHKDWLAQAEALPDGGRAMVGHSCGDGRKMLIEHKATGYAAWCYRCGIGGWSPKGRPSLADRIASMRKSAQADAAAQASMKPPFPAVFSPDDWPEPAKVWLYKAGFSKDWIEDLGFYYHTASERVVMPVLDTEDKLAFWQARGFSSLRPKYLSPRMAGGTKPLYKALPSLTSPVDIKAGVLTLTEDILSAARVGQTCEAWSLLGTAMSEKAEAEVVAHNASQVYVWLDPDKAGVAGRRKIVPRLRQLGVNAKAIRSDLDPKNYPFDYIRRRTHE